MGFSVVLLRLLLTLFYGYLGVWCLLVLGFVVWWVWFDCGGVWVVMRPESFGFGFLG